jgi:hypothetical protein
MKTITFWIYTKTIESPTVPADITQPYVKINVDIEEYLPANIDLFKIFIKNIETTIVEETTVTTSFTFPEPINLSHTLNQSFEQIIKSIDTKTLENIVKRHSSKIENIKKIQYIYLLQYCVLIAFSQTLISMPSFFPFTFELPPLSTNGKVNKSYMKYLFPIIATCEKTNPCEPLKIFLKIIKEMTTFFDPYFFVTENDLDISVAIYYSFLGLSTYFDSINDKIERNLESYNDLLTKTFESSGITTSKDEKKTRVKTEWKKKLNELEQRLSGMSSTQYIHVTNDEKLAELEKRIVSLEKRKKPKDIE